MSNKTVNPPRDSKGRIKKGQSLNPSGRPKSAKLTQKDKDELVKIVKANVKDKNLLSDMLEFLLKRANDINEVHKYLKEYAPFLTPKLSSIKQEIMEDKVITFKIEGLEEELEMVDVTPNKKLDKKDDNKEI
jgi:hypothetical protein